MEKPRSGESGSLKSTFVDYECNRTGVRWEAVSSAASGCWGGDSGCRRSGQEDDLGAPVQQRSEHAKPHSRSMRPACSSVPLQSHVTRDQNRRSLPSRLGER